MTFFIYVLKISFTQDYALIIYQMADMEEVGLTGLTRILRGGVRIEKNPKLCYERDIPNGGTIDWKEILQSEYYTNYMKIEVHTRKSTKQTVLG